jgi:hypothetical protein
MGEGEGKERKSELGRTAQETNHVSRRPQEDRSRAACSLGKSKVSQKGRS